MRETWQISEVVSTGSQNITEFHKFQIGHILKKNIITIICECQVLAALLLQIYLEYYAVHITLLFIYIILPTALWRWG
jgi:hypothetical protein